MPEYLGADDGPAEENGKKVEGGEGDLIEMKESDGQVRTSETEAIV